MAGEVRMSDIASKLGVSTVTVSKAMSGQKGVSEELRNKILSLAHEMGYEKKSQSSIENHNIGVVVAERFLIQSQSFYWKLYQEISQCCIANGCLTFLEVVSPETEEIRELPQIVAQGKADGVIIIGNLTTEYLNYLENNINIPIVLADGKGDKETGAVVTDNIGGGYEMTNYLFNLGHRKIGYVGTVLATPSIEERFLGYVKSLIEHGIPFEEKWIIDDRNKEDGMVDSELLFKLPDKKNMPTAFFCNCDVTAAYMINKLQKLGYKVPKDISVVGFDDYLNGVYVDTPITTYRLNISKMASTVVNMMLTKIKNSSHSPGVSVLSGEFVERSSAASIGSPVSFL